jgi:hypothetical protein
MPESRRRKDRNGKPVTHRPGLSALALDRLFDVKIRQAFAVKSPPVLYHYTSAAALPHILKSRELWATDHGCTNDDAELTSANDVIEGVAEELLASAEGLSKFCLTLFRRRYRALAVSEQMRVYLTCFSALADDRNQWEKYGRNGTGYCLGINVLHETLESLTSLGLAHLQVDYSETSWREAVRRHFGEVLAELDRATHTRKNAELGMLALVRIAAFMSISAKRGQWAVEQEYRRAAFVKRGAVVVPSERVAEGRTIKYLALPVRPEHKLISLATITAGPNVSAEWTPTAMEHMLADAGYAPDQPEYPRILQSAVEPWPVG